jgi:hypothetical protein
VRPRVAGMEKAEDAMNRRAEQRHSFMVERLPDNSTLGSSPLTEALTDNTVTPPPDAAAFRVDFPRWLGSLGDRDRRLALELVIGERTGVAAQRFGMSKSRVSQMRRELGHGWAQFHGEPALEVA